MACHQPSDQFALKPGEKIAVLPHLAKKTASNKPTAGGTGVGGGKVLGLRPPPPAGSTVTMHVTTPVNTTATATAVGPVTATDTTKEDEEEWGEFA